MVELEIRIQVPLDSFELSVEIVSDAHVLGVFGPSGAGKSSLLEAVAGLRRDVRGLVRYGSEVWLDTERGVYERPERRGVGFVPQDAVLFPHWSVRQNLSAGAGERRALDRDIDALAERLGIAPLLSRQPLTLSGGERQRVALGRALLSFPRLLLLDEPFAALDIPRRRQLVPLLEEVCQSTKVPVLFVSHEPTEMAALADRVIALDRGQLVPFDDPREA